MISNGCATTVVNEAPLHCDTKTETFLYDLIAIEKLAIFNPNLNGEATENLHLARRLDYLEAYCASVNSYRGEKDLD